MPIADRLRYAFDNFMGRGTIALIAGLFVVAVLGILAVSLAVQLLGFSREGTTLSDLIWNSLLRTLDPGTMGADEGSFGFLAGMLAVTMLGIFVISALIGIINTGLETKLADLRKGRSLVVEHGHSVILGWSEEIFTIIAELIEANESVGRSVVVVLAPLDKVEMDEAIRRRVGGTGRTAVVCRTGRPSDVRDLQIASLDSARSIIVLSPDRNGRDADVIKTVLAVTRHPRRRAEPYHMVAELRDASNLEVARLIGGDEVQFVLADDVIARIIAQTSRQAGLSVVYNELLGFSGDEMYLSEQPGLVGQTFGDALLAFSGSTLIGLRPSGGRARLNPPMDTVIAPGDEMVVISADENTIVLAERPVSFDPDAIRAQSSRGLGPEATLILGWNGRAPTVIRELDRYVAPGSTVTVVADLADLETRLAPARLDLANQSVEFRIADTTRRSVLVELDLSSYDHVIVLCYSDDLDPEQADAKTIVTLLHVRDLEQRGGFDVSVVSEMLDVHNRRLAEVTQADDFVVSSRLISQLLAQLSENRHLEGLFEDLFDADGSEVYFRPADDYVDIGRNVDFATLVAAARERGEIAIGYHKVADDGIEDTHGVQLNPPMGDPLSLSSGDQVVVIAEGQRCRRPPGEWDRAQVLGPVSVDPSR